MIERYIPKKVVHLVAASSILLGGLAHAPRVVHAQEKGDPPAPLFIPYDNLSEHTSRSRENYPPFDWEGLRERYEGEEWEFPVQVGYEAQLNYYDYAGPIVTCDDVYESANPDPETKRVCAAVGITEDADLTAVEEEAQFRASAQYEVQNMSREMIDSEAPIRFKLVYTHVGEGGHCIVNGAFCLIFTNLIHHDPPYLGYVQAAPDPRDEFEWPWQNKPQANPAFVDPYAASGLQGCAPDVPQIPAEARICNGQTVLGNGIVIHEIGHTAGNEHPFEEDTCEDRDSIGDTAPEKGPKYSWGCEAGETEAAADSCIDELPDNVRNIMGYYYELQPDGTYSADGKMFTEQQILRMLATIEGVYRDTFAGGRRSDIRDVRYTTTENATTVVIEVKAGKRYQLNLYHQSADPTLWEIVILPSKQELGEASNIGETTTVTHTFPFTDGVRSLVALQTGPIPVGNSYAFEDQAIWQITATTGYLGNGDIDMSITNSQAPFTDEGATPPDENQCDPRPFDWELLPIILKNESLE